MTRHNLLTVALFALATAFLTLIAAWPSSLNAVDPVVKVKAENPTPKLTANGVELTLKVVSPGDAKKGPSLELIAMNPTKVKASVQATVAMLERSPVAAMSRTGPMEVPDYSQNQPVIIDPGQTLTFKIDPSKAARPGSTVRFTLAAAGNTVSVPGFVAAGGLNVPTIDGNLIVNGSTPTASNPLVNGTTPVSAINIAPLTSTPAAKPKAATAAPTTQPARVVAAQVAAMKSAR